MHHSLSPIPRTPRATRTPPTRRNAKLVGSPKAQTKTTAKSRSPKRSPARTTSSASSAICPQPLPATSRPNLPEASQTPIGFKLLLGIPRHAQEIESSALGSENVTDKEMADDDPVEEGSLENKPISSRCKGDHSNEKLIGLEGCVAPAATSENPIADQSNDCHGKSCSKGDEKEK